MIGYRQASDTTLLHLARVGGLKLVTFDGLLQPFVHGPNVRHSLTRETVRFHSGKRFKSVFVA